ncbi:MAG: helix-turn-helix transcriptional regulator [Labilibaculum antarcticum]
MQFLDTQDLSVRKLEAKIGLSNGTFSKVKKGSAIGSDKMMLIFDAFPSLNPEWLFIGVGNMLKDGFKDDSSKNLHKNKSEDKPQTFSFKEAIDIIELPYVSLTARASFASSCDNVYEPQDTYSVYRNSQFDYNNVKVLEVNGDSMEPTLVSGEKVLIREVNDSNWEYFIGLAAVAFKDMFVVKRITRNTGGILTLNSDNPFGGSFDVKIDDVCCIYKIEHSVYRPLK